MVGKCKFRCDGHYNLVRGANFEGGRMSLLTKYSGEASTCIENTAAFLLRYLLRILLIARHNPHQYKLIEVLILRRFRNRASSKEFISSSGSPCTTRSLLGPSSSRLLTRGSHVDLLLHAPAGLNFDLHTAARQHPFLGTHPLVFAPGNSWSGYDK